jgi:hypothetical protein
MKTSDRAHLDLRTRLLRLLRGLLGFRMYPQQETGHDRAERREREWYPH